jgi:2-haloalkanoic acid dehalogenase type II
MTDHTITWATFDCYGTLVDWEGGFGSFLYQIALMSGDEAPLPGPQLREDWESIQFEVIQGPYRSYKDVLAESVRGWCTRHGYPYVPSYGSAAVTAMRAFQPFHDTRPALTRVKQAGIRLAIISNTDHDILNHTLNQLQLEFDEVITAEDCQAYKPSRSVFEKALAQLGTPAEQMIHVAFGFKYDIGPARTFGWKTAWVNRNAEPVPDDTPADHVWRDLWGLAALSGDPYELERP